MSGLKITGNLSKYRVCFPSDVNGKMYTIRPSEEVDLDFTAHLEEVERLKSELEALKCCGTCDSWGSSHDNFMCLQAVTMEHIFPSVNKPSHRCDRWEKRK